MLQTRLRQLLEEHGVTPYRFAKTIEAQGERSRSWAYRTVRGEIGLTTEGIDLIIRCLRELTGKPIAVQDVMGYVEAQEATGDEGAEEQVWELIFQESTPREEVLPVLLTPSQDAAYQDAAYRPSARFRWRGWWLIPFLLIFVLGATSQRLYQFSVDRRELILLSQPTRTPVQIGPEGDSQSLTPKLRVDPVEGATNYEFSVFNLESRQNVLNENTDEPFFIVPENAVCAGALYGWSAKVFRGGEWSSFSSRMEFVISEGEGGAVAQQRAPPEIPKAVLPQEVVTTLTPTLEVTPVEEATGYGFYLRDLDTDQVYEFEYASTTPTFTLPEGLVREGGRYRWNARARNCAGFSVGYTDTLEFQVDIP